jgi:hypothetical protein
VDRNGSLQCSPAVKTMNIGTIQSGIHRGEIEGKDSVLMLVRDMTVSKIRTAWLDKAIFVIIPAFHIDGHDDFSPFHPPKPERTGAHRPAHHGPALESSIATTSKRTRRKCAPGSNCFNAWWFERSGYDDGGPTSAPS